MNSQSEETLKVSIIAQVLLTYLTGLDEWSGTPTTLLNNMNEVAETMGVSVRAKDWPKRAHILTRRLNVLAPSLLKVEGLRIESRGGKRRQIRLYRDGITPRSSVSSVVASSSLTKGDAIDATDADLRSYSKEEDV